LPAATELVTAPAQGLLRIKTDVLDVQIDTLGGDIVDLSLPTYTKTVDSKEAFSLLENNRQRDVYCTIWA
jgi:YidC/Oxa1 family membrane protein insertase